MKSSRYLPATINDVGGNMEDVARKAIPQEFVVER